MTFLLFSISISRNQPRVSDNAYDMNFIKIHILCKFYVESLLWFLRQNIFSCGQKEQIEVNKQDPSIIPLHYYNITQP